MDYENEDRGWTLGQIWNMIKKRIWLILCVSLLLSIVAALFMNFVVDPKLSEYELTFELSYPGSETLKYPDGTPFHFQDIVSEEYLEQAQASEAMFSSIDVILMAEEDGISIIEETETINGVTQGTGKYILTAEKDYFSDLQQANLFMKAVAKVPIEIAKKKMSETDYQIEYSIFEDVYFEDRLDLLSVQKQRLLEQYDDWIKAFEGNYIVAGKTLSNYRAEVSSCFSDTIQSELLSELKRYNYVPVRYLNLRLAELKAERGLNDKKIAELRAALASFSEQNTEKTGSDDSGKVLQMLAELLVRNVDIDSKLQALTTENVSTFEARITSEYERLYSAATRIEAVAAELYAQESRVVFETTQLTEAGGVSPLLVGVGAFVILFLVFCAIAWSVELGRMRKATEQQKGAAEEQPTVEQGETEKETVSPAEGGSDREKKE